MIAPMCIGRDPLAIEGLMLELQQKLHIFGRGGPVIFGLSGIDIALWDIAGKAAGQPVHQLLGGARASKLPCYASLIRYTEPKVVATNVERALSPGLPPRQAARDRSCPYARRARGRGRGRGHHARRELSVVAARSAGHDAEAAAVQPALAGRAGVAAGELRRAGAGAGKRRHPDRGGRERSDPAPVSADVRGRARWTSSSPARSRWAACPSCARSSSLAGAHNVTVMPHSFYDGPGLLAAVHVNAALGQGSLVEWRFFDLEARLYGDRRRADGRLDRCAAGPWARLRSRSGDHSPL